MYDRAREDREKSPDLSHCTKVTGNDQSADLQSPLVAERVEEHPWG